jgi:hypothetical protein
LLNSYSFDADQRLTGEVQQQQTGGNGVAPNEIDFAYNALGQFTSALAMISSASARAPALPPARFLTTRATG